jgi:hypothetical protein
MFTPPRRYRTSRSTQSRASKCCASDSGFSAAPTHRRRSDFRSPLARAHSHDHGGNVSAQIAYTRNAQNKPLSGAGLPSTRWNFPNYWHNVTERFTVGGGKSVELEVLLFDSVLMVGNTDIYDEDGNEIGEVPLSEAPGSADPANAAQQLAWLEDRMAKSTADYLWVGAHYPVWAIGQDGPVRLHASANLLLHVL